MQVKRNVADKFLLQIVFTFKQMHVHCINIKCWLISWNNSIYPDDKNLPTNVHPCFTGHGVFTTRIFNKGDFLLEYVGKRICVQEEADAIDKTQHS